MPSPPLRFRDPWSQNHPIVDALQLALAIFLGLIAGFCVITVITVMTLVYFLPMSVLSYLGAWWEGNHERRRQLAWSCFGKWTK